MTIHLKIVFPAAPWTRSMTVLPQVRQPRGKVNVCYPVRIRKGSLFLRTRAQFFHSNIRATTPKGPPSYRGGVVCVSRWSVELCQLGLWLLVGPPIQNRSKDVVWSPCSPSWGLHWGLITLFRKTLLIQKPGAKKIHFIGGTLWPPEP